MFFTNTNKARLIISVFASLLILVSIITFIQIFGQKTTLSTMQGKAEVSAVAICNIYQDPNC